MGDAVLGEAVPGPLGRDIDAGEVIRVGEPGHPSRPKGYYWDWHANRSVAAIQLVNCLARLMLKKMLK
jgi:hypothetical protein